MQVKDPEIFSLLEKIGHHYRTNIANRFTRHALSTMSFEGNGWALIEEMTEKVANYRYQGYHIDELYLQILAMARFVYQSRRQLAPNLRMLAGAGHGQRVTEADRVFRDMAINNFDSNLKLLSDMINDLYTKVAALDREDAGTKPTVLSRIPELKEIGRYLVD